ncbi:hypothetical protein ABGB17_38235 [Sphaerisporangium sp. B11E5]|uniref:hypothetical protein n=1 Tax=Sphaerisporangium sp. B11E5 TaxID=3153563 RepID=UPI00325F3BD2
MRVGENVALPLRQRGLPKARRREPVSGALDAVGLSDAEARDQLHTRGHPRFTALRTHVREQIQAAKRGLPSPARAGNDGA